MPTLVLTATTQGFSSTMGRKGIAIRPGSGQLAYVEATVSRHGHFVNIGLAESTVQLPPRHSCGEVQGTWGWWCNETENKMPGLKGLKNFFVEDMIYRLGDVLGILVDCRATPKLTLYVNGEKVFVVPIEKQAHGKVWCAVGSVFMDWEANGGVLHFEAHPALPPL